MKKIFVIAGFAGAFFVGKFGVSSQVVTNTIATVQTYVSTQVESALQSLPHH